MGESHGAGLCSVRSEMGTANNIFIVESERTRPV